ncbi:hypothetical protein Glove_535g63 [Diversispora epigaea]|uniref:Uncharacterized protein n=1 Tax=Diversispora epigaea TaxID=1348612 RepID=A0A397GFQ6_9GLOM|nr:hypothetical protein Glove_535g63 [Diversispora epigaea]
MAVKLLVLGFRVFRTVAMIVDCDYTLTYLFFQIEINYPESVYLYPKIEWVVVNVILLENGYGAGMAKEDIALLKDVLEKIIDL